VAVLLGEQGCYAVRPSNTPVIMQSGLTDHFLRGAYYPEGGGQVIAGRLIQAIRAYGGEVRTNSPVHHIRVEKGRVLGVVTGKKNRDPVEIDAPVVVSNADLKRTVLGLVGEEHFRSETVDRVRGFRMSLPLFAIYLGLDVDLAARGLPNTNYWIWDSYDIERIYEQLEEGRFPDANLAYVTVTSIRDPRSTHIAPAGHTNLQVMTLVPHEYALWHVDKGPAEGGRYHRDPEYRRRKAELTDQLLATAERLVPGLGEHTLREHTEWKEAATPVTQERFTHSTGGTSYGIEFATDQMGPMRIGPGTEVPGLFLCGSSTPEGHGIANVMLSGVVAAGAATAMDLLPAVLAGEVLADRSLLPELRDDWDAWRESH
jgi:phytoene dehydrogenase-like protein